jgi:Phosphotransferase enzyme family
MTAYVDIVVEIFRLSVPLGIGSAAFGTADIITVGPVIGSTLRRSSSKVFDNIFEYFDFLVTYKRQAITSMNAEDQPRAQETLTSVEARTRSILQGITDPSFLRGVLTHIDLHSHNLLVDSNGRITAVLDWELNLIQPAIIGADYPEWFWDQGPDDPQFADENTWWEVSPAERDKVLTQFEEVGGRKTAQDNYLISLFQMVKERDPQFYKCLIEGRDLRTIVMWLKDERADPGFDRMRLWATSELK